MEIYSEAASGDIMHIGSRLTKFLFYKTLVEKCNKTVYNEINEFIIYR